MKKSEHLLIAGEEFRSRLFVGTGKFASTALMQEALKVSGSELVTVALKRVETGADHDTLVDGILAAGAKLLPNTSGARNAEEAIFAARLAREAFGTHFVKVEIHPDQKYLLPDPIETLRATERLAKEGFAVLPYIPADPVLCKRLEDAGAAAVMPLAAPIGTNKGMLTRDFIKIIVSQSNLPVVVDAGIGAPSHAAEAMEMGVDAVLVNTAIAVASDPIAMAEAFKMAVEAGRKAYLAGLATMAESANATSPLEGFFDNL